MPTHSLLGFMARQFPCRIRQFNSGITIPNRRTKGTSQTTRLPFQHFQSEPTVPTTSSAPSAQRNAGSYGESHSFIGAGNRSSQHICSISPNLHCTPAPRIFSLTCLRRFDATSKFPNRLKWGSVLPATLPGILPHVNPQPHPKRFMRETPIRVPIPHPFLPGLMAGNSQLTLASLPMTFTFPTPKNWTPQPQNYSVHYLQSEPARTPTFLQHISSVTMPRHTLLSVQVRTYSPRQSP